MTVVVTVTMTTNNFKDGVKEKDMDKAMAKDRDRDKRTDCDRDETTPTTMPVTTHRDAHGTATTNTTKTTTMIVNFRPRPVGTYTDAFDAPGMCDALPELKTSLEWRMSHTNWPSYLQQDVEHGARAPSTAANVDTEATARF